MRYDELYERLRVRSDLQSSEAARDAASAVLRTLRERFSHGEAEPPADDLPDGLAGPVSTPGGEAESPGPEEFVDRVADRFDVVDPDGAERYVQATFETLGGETLEVDDVRRQLPREYAPLYEVG